MSLSVCQVARATGEAKCHGSKLHKEVTEIKVYWFVCLNTFKFAKSKNGLYKYINFLEVRWFQSKALKK